MELVRYGGVSLHLHGTGPIFYPSNDTGGADKSLARPGRKRATATVDFDVHISYLLLQFEEYYYHLCIQQDFKVCHARRVVN